MWVNFMLEISDQCMKKVSGIRVHGGYKLDISVYIDENR